MVTIFILTKRSETSPLALNMVSLRDVAAYFSVVQ